MKVKCKSELYLALILCLEDGLQNSISGGFCFRDARVVKDMATGKSKGYGFVSFFNKWVSTIISAYPGP